MRRHVLQCSCSFKYWSCHASEIVLKWLSVATAAVRPWVFVVCLLCHTTRHETVLRWLLVGTAAARPVCHMCLPHHDIYRFPFRSRTVIKFSPLGLSCRGARCAMWNEVMGVGASARCKAALGYGCTCAVCAHGVYGAIFRSSSRSQCPTRICTASVSSTKSLC